jgi:LCP family protein required for cell wall assembly
MTRFTSRRAVIALVALLGVGSVAVGFVATQHLFSGHRTGMETLREAFVPPPQLVFGKNDLRVLVVGLDYDYTGTDIETSAHARSDLIMAVRLDFTHRRIDELSVPRDMVATMPDGHEAKINEAQSDGGVRESEAVVADWLGSPPFDKYVVLRIDTMKDIINAIGGVTVDVKNANALKGVGPNGPVDYDDSWGHLHVHLKPGVQHLDGAEAVGYARFRHDWCSDPCRIMRQQDVIHAISHKLAANKAITLLHLSALLDVIHKDVETNLTPSQELSLAAAFANVPPKDIVTAQVPYVGSVDLPGEGNSIVPDQAAKRVLVARMLADPAQSTTPIDASAPDAGSP